MKTSKVYFFEGNNNFGDQLNVLILEKVFNIKVEWSNTNQASLVCIGSLLESFLHHTGELKLFLKRLILPKLHVWGTGFIDVENSSINLKKVKREAFYKRMEIHALRGEISKQRMEKILGKTLNNIILGDPGLLASKIIDSNIEKKYKVGIIPHYYDKENELVEELKSKFENAIVIDVLSPTLEVLIKIAECEVILSSAMHGLIAADSFGIPNQRIIFSDKLRGGHYKFNDYYSALGIKNYPFIDFRKDKSISIEKVILDYQVDFNKVVKIQDKLISSFPKI